MSKKDFSKGLDSLLGEGSTTKKAKPQTPVQSKTRETRATFIVNEAKLEKIKSLARTEVPLIPFNASLLIFRCSSVSSSSSCE